MRLTTPRTPHPIERAALLLGAAVALISLASAARSSTPDSAWRARYVGPLLGADLSDGGEVVGPGFRWVDGQTWTSPLIAWALNDRGDIVGAADLGGVAAPFRRTAQQQGPAGFHIAPDGHDGAALGVNEGGIVVGAAALDGPGAPQRAFLWTGGATLRDLGTLGGPWSVAHDINAGGVVVGAADDAAGISRPFVWRSGRMERLDALGDHAGTAHALNRRNAVAGWIADGGQTRGFLVRGQEARLFEPGSRALDLNDRGEVVGERQTPGGQTRGALWRGDVVVDLHAALPTGAWDESRAVAVNDAGAILVVARPRAETGWHSFVLEPVPDAPR